MQWGKFHWLFFQIAPIWSAAPLVQSIFAEYGFQDKSDLNRYESLLRKLPDFIDRIHISVREQAARGIVLPKAEIPIVTGFLTFYLQDAAQSPFFVQQQRLQTIEPAQATEFQNRISEIIQRQVNPAFKSLLNYVSHEYADRAPERVGLSQYPGGKGFIAFWSASTPHWTFLQSKSTALDLILYKSPKQRWRSSAAVWDLKEAGRNFIAFSRPIHVSFQNRRKRWKRVSHFICVALSRF